MGDRVKDRIALITGAGSGIGRGTAIALAAEGAIVAITDIDEAGLQETARLVREAGGRVATYVHDVTSETRWQEVLAAVQKDFGGLHILVNNAGIGIACSIFEMSYADWTRQQTINVDGVFFGLKHGIPMMAASGGGSVINISSVAGLRGSPGLAAYCATKGAVRLLTKAVALECTQANFNVRVNSVHPGIIDTAIWQKIPQAASGTLRGGNLAMPAGANAIDPNALAATAPMAYAGLPSDIAAGILYLASAESRYVTGTELVIDGGITAR